MSTQSKKPANPEKERCLAEALTHTFTVDELKERLKNNNITLFLEFLKKLKVETTQQEKTNFDLILDILANKLITDEGKRAASKILGISTYKDLYSVKRSSTTSAAQQAHSQSGQVQGSSSQQQQQTRELQSIQQREEMIQQYHRNQIAQNQQAIQQQQLQAQTLALLQKQQLEHQQKLALKMTQQKVDQARQQALLQFDQVTQKPSIFTISYDQLKLQSAPVPFYNQRKQTCLCGTATGEIVCQTCQVGYHKACMKRSAEMKQFMCASCQLNLLDPTSIPVMHLLEPFLVLRGGQDEEIFPEPKLFEFKEQAKQMVAQRKDISIQLRCVQLGEALVHAMPKFGAFRLCNERRTHQVFKVQDPPNDRKRKDKVMDLTTMICQDVQPVHGLQFSLELMHRVKHEGDNKLWYVAGVYICKQFTVQDIASFVETLQPRLWFQLTYDKIKKWHSQRDEDDIQVATKVINVSLICKISMCPMKTPVKGQWCDHYECFDLHTYIESNTKAQVWKCPVCPSDKPVNLQRCEFMMALIEVAQGESEAEIDYETLEVKFNHGVYALTPDGLQAKEKQHPSAVSCSDPATTVSSMRPSVEPELVAHHQQVLSDGGGGGAPSAVITSPPSQAMQSLGKRQRAAQQAQADTAAAEQQQPQQFLQQQQSSSSAAHTMLQQQQMLFQQKRQQKSPQPPPSQMQQPQAPLFQQQQVDPHLTQQQIQYMAVAAASQSKRLQSPQHQQQPFIMPQQQQGSFTNAAGTGTSQQRQQQIPMPRNQQELVLAREAHLRATAVVPTSQQQQAIHSQQIQASPHHPVQHQQQQQYGSSGGEPHRAVNNLQQLTQQRKGQQQQQIPPEENVIELE